MEEESPQGAVSLHNPQVRPAEVSEICGSCEETACSALFPYADAQGGHTMGALTTWGAMAMQSTHDHETVYRFCVEPTGTTSLAEWVDKAAHATTLPA